MVTPSKLFCSSFVFVGTGLPNAISTICSCILLHNYDYICGYLSEKVTHWLFKIFEIQKGHTFSFNDILRLCTIVVNIAMRIRA